MHTQHAKKKTILVGQSGGPTAAINASLAGVYETAHACGAHTLGMRYGIEGFMRGGVVDLDERLADPLSVELLERTPSSYLGSCRYKLKPHTQDPEPYHILFERFEDFGIYAVLYIGGNDSMDTIAKLSAYGEEVGSDVRFIGIPKTIDNDLVLTDHTPGYGSAAKYIAASMSEIVRDSSVYDLKSATFVEIMGRDAGWLAGASCLAESSGVATPDLCLLPEVTLDTDAMLNVIAHVLEVKNTAVIAVSEGVRNASGELVCATTQDAADGTRLDAFGHVASLSGTGRFLASLTRNRLGCKTRAVELSTLQRCASHMASSTDLHEAHALGGAGVLSALDGMTGKMTALVRASDVPYLVETALVDVQEVANKERKVPRSFIRSDGMGVTPLFERYARPLISGEISPIMAGGVPRHIEPLGGGLA